MSPAEMKQIIDRIIAAGDQLRRYHDLDFVASAGAPADELDLQRLQAKYGKLPPSYIQFLSLYDGISNFEWPDVEMCSVQYLLDHEHRDESWIESGAFAAGDLFIIARSDFDPHNVAFLRRTADARGEMKVLHFDSVGPLSEHDDFASYLRERLAWLEESLAGEQADRASLSDDE